MSFLSQLFDHRPPAPNPLTGPVGRFSTETRLLLRQAAVSSPLYRATWNGCPLNRAGELLGAEVHDCGSAAAALGASRDDIQGFIHAWDGVGGRFHHRNQLLIDAIDESLVRDLTSAVEDHLTGRAPSVARAPEVLLRPAHPSTGLAPTPGGGA
jgi:hypothetical protein